MKDTEAIDLMWRLLSEDNFRTYNLFVAKILWIHEAIFLSHAIRKHWYFKEQGWLYVCKGIEDCFFLTVNSIEDSTWLSTDIQRKVKAVLIKKWIITIQKAGIPAKNYFKIHFEVLYDTLKMAKESVPGISRNKSREYPVTGAGNIPEHYNTKYNTKYNNTDWKNKLQANATASLADDMLANEKKTAKEILSAYEIKGAYDIKELTSKLVIDTYEASGLDSLAINFLDYYVGNPDKIKWKVNIKSRFNKFVTSDFQWLLKKKSTWPGIESITDDQFQQLLDNGHFKSSSCNFFREQVSETLDAQWRNTFNLMIDYFRNKDVVWWKEYPTFKEWAIWTKRIIW